MSTLRPTTIGADANQNLDGTLRTITNATTANATTAGNMTPAGDTTMRPSEPMKNDVVLNDSDVFVLKGVKYHNQKLMEETRLKIRAEMSGGEQVELSF